jgi:hypothetical protein
MSELAGYISQLNTHTARKNGAVVAQLLSLPVSGGVSPQVRQFVDKIKKSNITSYCENNYSDSNTCGIVVFRLLALVALVDGDFETGNQLPCATSGRY